MNNIVIFRERLFAAKASASHILSVKAGARPPERAVSMPRPRLIAVWHTNPQTGGLECFWTTESGPVLDGDGSRQAA